MIRFCRCCIMMMMTTFTHKHKKKIIKTSIQTHLFSSTQTSAQKSLQTYFISHNKHTDVIIPYIHHTLCSQHHSQGIIQWLMKGNQSFYSLLCVNVSGPGNLPTVFTPPLSKHLLFKRCGLMITVW